MPLSIQDILDNPALQTRLVSGEGGACRKVRWAHACELHDPTKWLSDGDLLMTTGMGIPHDPPAQRRYIARLVDAKVCALMIGENMQAPEDIAALCEEATSLGFPVLLTHYSVPFSAVSRAIIDASRQEEHDRRTAVTRLYESARISMRGMGLSVLLNRLANDIKAKIFLFDSETLAPWHAGLAPLSEAWCLSLSKRRPENSSVQRYSTENEDGLVMSLPSTSRCSILASGGHLLDYAILHHVVAVLSIELEREQMEHERTLRHGSELLDDILQLRLTEQAAQKRMAMLNCPVQSACIAVGKTLDASIETWTYRLQRQEVNFLVRQQAGESIIILQHPDQAPLLQRVMGIQMGVSNPLGHALRALDALGEARLALGHATAHQALVRYGDGHSEYSWLPSTLEEASKLHRRILGALTDYDKLHNGELTHTLKIFLEDNRSWQRAALRLDVHRQTLVYRIRRIEEITGRLLDSTEDVAMFWIALRVGEMR